MKSKSLNAIFIILISTFCSSCNSVGPNSDKIVGEWVEHHSNYSERADYGLVSVPGFKISWETIWDLEKGGTGKVISKQITVWDDKKMPSTSRTIEYPIKWETKNDGKEDFLIMKYGTGKITDIQAEDKLKEEQNGADIMKIFNGLTDTTYFKVQPDKKIEWHVKNSTKEFEMAKR